MRRISTLGDNVINLFRIRYRWRIAEMDFVISVAKHTMCLNLAKLYLCFTDYGIIKDQDSTFAA